MAPSPEIREIFSNVVFVNKRTAFSFSESVKEMRGREEREKEWKIESLTFRDPPPIIRRDVSCRMYSEEEEDDDEDEDDEDEEESKVQLEREIDPVDEIIAKHPSLERGTFTWTERESREREPVVISNSLLPTVNNGSQRAIDVSVEERSERICMDRSFTSTLLTSFMCVPERRKMEIVEREEEEEEEEERERATLKASAMEVHAVFHLSLHVESEEEDEDDEDDDDEEEEEEE